MQNLSLPVAVKVWGPLACFTNPAMKVERLTYPVMTPSAARGIVEAIFWKPECLWLVDEIWVLNPIRYLSLLRNEVNSRQSERAARGWAQNGGGFVASEDRAQRHTLALRDVAYIIRGRIAVMPGVEEHPAKFVEQFRRRVRRGRCFTRPYLGCREFAADFAKPDGSEQPIERDEALGLMLLDLNYASDGSGRGTPKFFDARLEKGVLRVPTRPLDEGGPDVTAATG